MSVPISSSASRNEFDTGLHVETDFGGGNTDESGHVGRADGPCLPRPSLSPKCAIHTVTST